MRYALLLRGINVGKSIKVSMKELKSSLEEISLKNVITYLNSGNIIFDSNDNQEAITNKIKDVIKAKYNQNIPLLVIKSDVIIDIANSIPSDWQNDESQQTYIAYLFNEADDEKIILDLPVKKEYIEIYYRNSAFIWNIKREFYNKSQITKLASHKSYEYMTTRNVNTARKLAELCSVNIV